MKMENKNMVQKKINKNTKLKLFTILLSLHFSTYSMAQSKDQKSDEKPSSATSEGGTTNDSSDKIDVESLEKKYWSSKDDDFTVVQNRTFTKDRKFFISLSTGKIVNDGFLEGTLNNYSFGYFFNEKLGVSYDYTGYNTHDNSVTKEFYTYGTKPAYNSLLNTSSLRLLWSPIYAKVSLLEKKILYLDMVLGLHAGTTRYKIMSELGGVRKSTSHYGFDITQILFINKWLALRFDIRNTWTTQKQLKYKDESDIGNTRFQDNAWLLGLNFYFGGKGK